MKETKQKMKPVVFGAVKFPNIDYLFNIADPQGKSAFDRMVSELEKSPIGQAKKRGRDIIDVRSIPY